MAQGEGSWRFTIKRWEFEEYLNKKGPSQGLAATLKGQKLRTARKHFGTWLRRTDPEMFSVMFEKWRKKRQEEFGEKHASVQ